ncbi:MAG: hypothetical protein JSR66_11650 [Proteobacteria bacterium]|nr:hypothetical protein [Pseudomonadota bacterium]
MANDSDEPFPGSTFFLAQCVLDVRHDQEMLDESAFPKGPVNGLPATSPPGD